MENKSAKILLDVPVEDGVLGFDNYRDALNSIIKSSDPHFTIGIFGGWGTGKTTLMKMMKKQLDEEGEITVWFNPWQYEKETHLFIPLLLSIKLELETKHKEDIGQTTLENLGRILKKVGKSIKPELTIGIAKVGLDTEKLLEEEKEDLASLYFQLNQEMKNVVEKIGKKDKNKIVLFIDDLDRCLPDKALQVLEAIKGFLDLDGYVFVLGLSRDIIEKCVDTKYGKESGISGSQYIRKMIQVPFTLPDLRDKEIGEYVKKLKDELKGSDVEAHVGDYFDIIVVGMEPNPREIKRFINNFILANRISQKETEPQKLLVVLIIQFRWENFYRDLTKYKKPFLEQTAVIVKSREELKKEEVRKTAKESWNFFDLIEGYLKNEQFRNFLEGAGKILFKIQDLDPYIHFSKSVVLEETAKKASGKRKLIDLLRKGDIREFDGLRSFPRVDLNDAELAGAYLKGIDLSGADLTGATLLGVDLSGSNLSNTILRHAIVAYANLQNADLTGADLRGANLREAILFKANLQDIVVDSFTIFDRTIIEGSLNLSPEIRDQLHVEIRGDAETAISKSLLQKRKSEGTI